MKPKILLANWTHRNNVVGGTESRYAYLNQIFPDAERISYADLFNNGGMVILNHLEAAKKMDEYYIKRHNEDKNLLIIRDASVGGILDTSHIPQITMFANPYASLSEAFGFGRVYWSTLIELQKKAKSKIKVATSNFMKKDMAKIGLVPDEIISNPIDIDFFKQLSFAELSIDREPKKSPKRRLRERYKIPTNRRIGIWVGDSGGQIKNINTILKLKKSPEVFWIMVTKSKIRVHKKNVAIFCNVNKETMRDLYNCADFFMLSSQIGGFGMATLEAMACELPCIISPAGYFHDFWDDRIGLKVACGDFQAHINAIRKINGIRTYPRDVIIERGLDLKTVKGKWEELVGRVVEQKEEGD